METATPKGRLIFGGSFNPIHAGHLRMALECKAKMSVFADVLEFLPTGVPPHKKITDLLPFDLRARIINEVITTMPGFICNESEHHYVGPTYTIDVMRKFASQQPGVPLYFILGSQDFALLPEWKEGLLLPEVCNLVVVPRGGYNSRNFWELSAKFWPNAIAKETNFNDSCLNENGICLRLNGAASLYWLEVPQLDISASRIRELWRCGRSLNFLTPEIVINILKREERIVRACWEKE